MQPIKIQFKNTQNPSATFDLLEIDNLYDRKDLDHSPMQNHKVEFYMIIFIEEGNGSHNIDFVDFDCEQGTIFTIRKDQIHRFAKEKTLKGKLLLFTDDFLVSYLEQLEAQKALQIFNELLSAPKIQLGQDEFKSIQHLVYRIQNEYFNTNDQYSLGIIRSELHILLTKLYRKKLAYKNTNLTKKYLNEFIQLQTLIEKHAVEKLQVQDYAKMMGVSTKTLSNITRSILNKGAKALVDEITIQQIKRLLINTEDSIKEIAYRMSFEETTNFYKYFKRHTSLTPELFRAQYS